MTAESNSKPNGSLTIVGTGIRSMSQMTNETIAQIQTAERVLFLSNDPVLAGIIKSMNPDGAEDMSDVYRAGVSRYVSIAELADRMLARVREGFQTCAAFFGHPGVFTSCTHDAIRRARSEGFEARVLPGISAEDCLFAELEIDPGRYGCMSFEAMDFLVNNRQVDPRCHVILWQIGYMGDHMYRSDGPDLSALPVMVEHLCELYRPDHEVIIYESALSLLGESYICRVPLQELKPSILTGCSTLCIPPVEPTEPDPQMIARLEEVGFPIHDRLAELARMKAEGRL